MRIKIFLLAIFTVTLLAKEEGFCIQALSYSSKDISKKMMLKMQKVQNRFNLARVEKRDKYYVFRIGKYETEYLARNDLRGIKRFFPYSYIRRCDYNKSSVDLIPQIICLIKSSKTKNQKNKKQIKSNTKKRVKLKIL